MLRKFIYGPGIDEPICMIDVTGGNAIYYYHFDGLGSVAALSNNSGQIVERYSYDVFGAPNRISDVNNPYMFTGRRFDPETALYYYRARYYAPDIGRFLQTDPIHYLGGLNLYTYVGNDPINWIDPYGLRHYNLEETQEIIDRGCLPGWRPWHHTSFFGRRGRYDYKNMGDMFTVPGYGRHLRGSEFGNYLAGYLGRYHWGTAGYLGMRAGGHWYA